ncbi:beta-ketoacyl synthase N-terminal-like domain-containing protein [Pseudochryseolinea flava]|uniref:Beta-ketoacyl synthase-like N-terminal domain-containing protein n=1 Tax=Pseudochryseolinea flava TaxID=2059302 RepID=A0A364Y0F3_9BACT|nr:beta-ketoacyl synthase N-terminal-like domain-containing protein [Pseudochryseolinea flava]RAW00149.1 hypothetical protein DQQ10_16505 [Pseudochryseolinea flava]
MKAYIKGIGNISPQQTWGYNNFLDPPLEYHRNDLMAVEPDYSQWINPQQLRRMSRVIKMGVTSALMALKDAELEKPDAIITGTGYGCVQDTTSFLTKITDFNEQALNPTPFIQSTHNTIGSQIALLLQCHGYNQTYVHGAFSFEHALLDALMSLQENSAQSILVGGVDELTQISHAIHTRFDKYRREVKSTLTLFDAAEAGTVAGEGAAYFVLSGKDDTQTKACIHAVDTLFQPVQETLLAWIESFVRDRINIPFEDIDLVLLGKSGDEKADKQIDLMAKTYFPGASLGVYKHLCGEHSVSSSFALALATEILLSQHIPEPVIHKAVSRPIRNVLIYNPYFYQHHSLIFLTECHDIK